MATPLTFHPDRLFSPDPVQRGSYSRELAPLAGHYPCLRLGPPWWFHDSPEGMIRFRKQAIETAGFYNTVGFNDDTRAFMSIPHATTSRAESIAGLWPSWWPNTGWTKTKRRTLRSTSHTGS